MRILFRYILKEFTIPFFYCLIGFVAIYILFELFGSFSRLAESNLPISMIIAYFFGYLSPYVVWLMPATLMLATLYTMWNFCRHCEIIAMRSSGISLFTISKPIIFAAVSAGLFVTWVNEYYAPNHAQWSKLLKHEKFNLSKTEKMLNIVYRNPERTRVWSIGNVEYGKTVVLNNVKVTVDGKNSAETMSITAPKAEYLDGEWWFTNPVVGHYGEFGEAKASKTPQLDALSLRVFPDFNERPQDIMMQNKDFATSSVAEKMRFYKKSRQTLTKKQKREMLYSIWAQILSPFACIVMTLFAIPAGIASSRQSVFKGIVGALGMFFAFYGITIGCMILANTGYVPPIPAAILPHAVFLTIGWRLFRKHR
jgi:LPS export ABC transporter permease LptG